MANPTTMSATDVLPCPFCGQLPTIQEWHGGPPTKRMISCDNDQCFVQPRVSGNRRSIAIQRWNTRDV